MSAENLCQKGFEGGEGSMSLKKEDESAAPSEKQKAQALNARYMKIIRWGQGQGPKLPQEELYDFPWVGPITKSMAIDLEQFKELDAYAQEVNVKDSVENLVGVLLQKAHSDLERVRAIWIWICHHIEFDMEGYRDRKKVTIKPAEIIQSGKTICSGYSRLFEKMCSIAGIPCEYLLGRSSQLKRHAWNAVRIDGRWHLLDCTWGRSKFSLGRNDYYFLTHPALFIADHFPDNSKWMLLKQAMIRTAALLFYKRYKMYKKNKIGNP